MPELSDRMTRILERGIEQWDQYTQQAEATDKPDKKETRKQRVFVPLHGPKPSSNYQIIVTQSSYFGAAVVNFVAAFLLHPIRSYRGLIHATASFPRKAMSYTKARFGGYVGLEEQAWRWNACRACDEFETVIDDDCTVKHFCGQCGCGHTGRAELTKKNALREWKCPLRKHPGPYPDDKVRAYLVENGYATEDSDGASGGNRNGCCGGKSDAGANGKTSDTVAIHTMGDA